MRILKIAILLVLLLHTLAQAQGSSRTSGPSIVTFILHEGNTIWGIWNDHANTETTWTEFYGEVASLNSTYAPNRFRSVPVGTEIRIPSSVLDITVTTGNTSLSTEAAEEGAATLPPVTVSEDMVFMSLESLNALQATLGAQLDTIEALTAQVDSAEGPAPLGSEPVTLERMPNWMYILLTLSLLAVLLVALFSYIFFRFFREEIAELKRKERSLHDENGRLRDKQESYSESEHVAAAKIESLKLQIEAHRGDRERMKSLDTENKRLRQSLTECSDERGELLEKLGLPGKADDTKNLKPVRHGSTHGRGRPRNTSRVRQ